MQKEKLLKKIIIAGTFFVAFFSVSLVSAQLRLPRKEVQAVDVKTEKTEHGEWSLTVVYMNGFKPNEKVPQKKRLTFKLDATKNGFDWSDFKSDSTKSQLLFKTEGSPKGILTVYVCRPDRCQRIRKEIDWT